MSSIRGIKKESIDLVKNIKTLESKIGKGQVSPDGTTAVILGAMHGKILRFQKQVKQETLRLERKNK